MNDFYKDIFEDGCNDEALDLAFSHFGIKVMISLQYSQMTNIMRIHFRIFKMEQENPFPVYLDPDLENAKKMIEEGPCYIHCDPSVYEQVKDFVHPNITFYKDHHLPAGKIMIQRQPKFDLSGTNIDLYGSGI